ncbi:hypothetical protein D3C77_585690 [compost metagenome]
MKYIPLLLALTFNIIFRRACNSEILYLFKDAVHRAGTKNDLKLPGIEKGSFYFIDILYSSLIDQIFIVNHNPQPCGAMREGCDIILSADGRYDLFCNILIFRHS